MDKIVCLVRAENDEAATQRIKDNMAQRQIEFDVQNPKLEIRAADLTKRDLGLTVPVYSSLVKEVDMFIHVSYSYHVLGRRSMVTIGGMACTFWK